MQIIKITSKEELIDIITKSAIDADLNHLDVSDITYVSDVFNGNVSQ